MPAGTSFDEALDDITPEGRVAGRTLAVLFVGTAVAVLVASWDDIWRRCGEISGPCVSRSSAAVILSTLAAVALVGGIAMWRRVGRRPVDAYGSSRYVGALGAVVVLGAVIVAGRIPAFTCAQGRFDELLELCMHPPSTSEPQRWILAKQVIVVAGVVAGIVVASRPRWVRVTAPVAAVTWFVALGWVLADTMA